MVSYLSEEPRGNYLLEVRVSADERVVWGIYQPILRRKTTMTIVMVEKRGFRKRREPRHRSAEFENRKQSQVTSHKTLFMCQAFVTAFEMTGELHVLLL